MAQSPTHRLGQFIGELIEKSLHKPLAALAKKHGLYLDYKHARPARDGKQKAAWRDLKGNTHDLDYVMEIGGTESMIGRPKAFIEVAYRRYTKHSRNKAQEMQGAIMPLAETYASDRPFLGVVLGGVFTANSVTQLSSHGFGVLHFPYASIVAAFKVVGVDVAFDEDSSDADVTKQVRACERLDDAQRTKVGKRLHQLHRHELNQFLAELETCLTRMISGVLVLALHGQSCESASIGQAVEFIRGHDESSAIAGFCRYEIHIRYNNHDEVRGNFQEKQEAIRFLETFR